MSLCVIRHGMINIWQNSEFGDLFIRSWAKISEAGPLQGNQEKKHVLFIIVLFTRKLLRDAIQQDLYKSCKKQAAFVYNSPFRVLEVWFRKIYLP